MSQQQTVLRVKTNIPSPISVTGNTSLSITGSSVSVSYSGTGTNDDPYIGSFSTGSTYIELGVQGSGVLYYNITLDNVSIGNNYLQAFIRHAGEPYYKRIFSTFAASNDSYFNVVDGDSVAFKQGSNATNPGLFSVYFSPDDNLVNYIPDQYDFLDLYNDIPLTIDKSFAELQDIAKRNSDYSVGVKLPGSKKNNRFFENFFNVDTQSLFFDATSKVECQVLINDEAYFKGYLKLNSTSVKDSKVEYDVTLYSNIGDLYGAIGNNLLRDLDFRDADYHFNHVFTRDNVLQDWRYETLKSSQKVPSNYFYPVMHNGYNYETSGNTTQVLYTGLTGTSLYTTTKLGSWADNTAAYAAGVQRYRINSPEDGVRDNQLKPALNVWSLIHLMFKQQGYTIKSDFMSSPWMKLLYMYGYYSNDTAKLTYKTPQSQTYGLEGVEVIWLDDIFATSEFNCATYYPKTDHTWNIYVVKKGTGTPVLCNQEIILNWNFELQPCYGGPSQYYSQTLNIPAGSTGVTFSYTQEQYVDCGYGCPFSPEYIYNLGFDPATSNVGLSSSSLAYLPQPANTVVEISDNNYIDFSLIIDENIKQIDVLASVAKKFNLVFVPDPDVPNQIIIEPYQYYVGTGQIYDWTDKLSWDKGFTVQPANNLLESEIILTDLEDGDTGNIEFKNANARIYGENKVYNPTDFKSQSKRIDTTFSPEIFRQWNPSNNPNFAPNDVGIPLGINYTESSQEISTENTTIIDWIYKGVKTKPKLFYNMGNFSPFLDNPSEVFNITGVTTSYFRVSKSDGTSASGGLISPVVSNTMPMGNPDSNKINNDSICILFNSEQPTTIAGGTVNLFNAYTNQDMYNLFYQDRVDNAFDKNTRILGGYFDLKLSDVKTITPKDLIKIKEQYFTWNKIENFNLTNLELTKAELVQVNYNPSEYPTRYFQYTYCGDPSTVYKFKTEFVGTDSIYESLFYWSILYDYFVGTLGGNVSGYTSSFQYTGTTYVPYSINEVSKNTYDTSGVSYETDPLRYYFLLRLEEEPLSTIYNQNNPVWLINSGYTQATLNVFTGCTDFSTTAATLGVNTTLPTTGVTYTTGITINVTDTGYIKYTTATGDEYQYVGSLGNYDIPACANCASVRIGIPFADLANFTIVDCGTPC
jgi:hypothetical protein